MKTVAKFVEEKTQGHGTIRQVCNNEIVIYDLTEWHSVWQRELMHKFPTCDCIFELDNNSSSGFTLTIRMMHPCRALYLWTFFLFVMYCFNLYIIYYTF